MIVVWIAYIVIVLIALLARVVLTGAATRHHEQRIQEVRYRRDEVCKGMTLLQEELAVVEQRFEELLRLEPLTNKIKRKVLVPVAKGVGEVAGGALVIAGHLISSGRLDPGLSSFGNNVAAQIAGKAGEGIAKKLDLGGRFSPEEMLRCEQAIPQLRTAVANAEGHLQGLDSKVDRLKSTSPTFLLSCAVSVFTLVAILAVHASQVP